jgi:flap endonuclease-1
MGIRLLNNLIKYSCRNALTTTHFKDLYGKTICIDTHIYMYKFRQETTLIEGMFTLCNLFKKYNITPIFVWDGKAPAEKKNEIERRKNEKKKLTDEYHVLKDELEKYNKNDDLLEQINILKKKIVKITHVDIKNIKNLFDAYGFTHMVAEGEADKLCAELVIKKIAYACISEDMDLFVYGCPRVLRYMHLKKQTFSLYNTSKILQNLGISLHHFKTICILCGTDYDDERRSAFKLYNYYQKWENHHTDKQFIVWVKENYFRNINIETYINTYELFQICNRNIDINIVNRSINKFNLQEILKLDNFIFP